MKRAVVFAGIRIQQLFFSVRNSGVVEVCLYIFYFSYILELLYKTEKATYNNYYRKNT